MADTATKQTDQLSFSITIQQTDILWSSEDKQVALAAIKKAYNQEVEKLIKTIRENASAVSKLDEVWQLHDYLSAKRHELDCRYDERESFLMFTLSQLIKDGLLDMSEIAQLDAAKKAKVRVLSRM